MDKSDINKTGISKLMETHKILHEEFTSMKTISVSLDSTSKTIRKIDTAYSNFGSQVIKSRSFLRELKTRLEYQDLIFYACFYFYLATCAWLVFKRFGLSLILTFLSDFFFSITGGLSSLITGEL